VASFFAKHTTNAIRIGRPAGTDDLYKFTASRPTLKSRCRPRPGRAGRDPQLEKAVQVALEELKKNPPPRPLRPKYPAHK
jgi:hypothetical protein